MILQRGFRILEILHQELYILFGNDVLIHNIEGFLKQISGLIQMTLKHLGVIFCKLLQITYNFA